MLMRSFSSETGRSGAQRGPQMMRALMAGALLLAFLVVATAGAAGQGAMSETGSYQEARHPFTSKKPGSPSGLIFSVDYVNPSDPQAKPPAVRRVVTTLARGAAYDPAALPPCTASDLELTLIGPSACVAGSRVGGGEATVDTGLPGPLRIARAHIDLFINGNQLIYVNTVTGTSVRTVIRAKVERRSLITEAPFLPGTPPEGGALDIVNVLQRRLVTGSGAERRAFITTPPRCPASGHWTNKVAFTYSNGTTQTVASPSPCRKAGRR
jgi:hypothetical protein